MAGTVTLRVNTSVPGRMTAAAPREMPFSFAISLIKSAMASMETISPPETILSGNSFAITFFSLPPVRHAAFTMHSPMSNAVICPGMVQTPRFLLYLYPSSCKAFALYVKINSNTHR